MKARFVATDFIQPILSVLFLLGILTVFQPCGPREDGAWMNCHWAGVAVACCAGVLLALSLLHLGLKAPGGKLACDLLQILAAVLAAAIPGNLIHLCMMTDMRCHSLTRPAAVVFAVLVMLAAVTDVFLQRGRGKA